MPFWLKPPLSLFRNLFVAMAEEVVPPWRCGAGGEEDEWDQAPSTANADGSRELVGLASEVGNSLGRVTPTSKWATPSGLPFGEVHLRLKRDSLKETFFEHIFCKLAWHDLQK